MQTLLSKLLMREPSEGGAERRVEDREQLTRHARRPTRGGERERMKEAGELAYRPLQLEH